MSYMVSTFSHILAASQRQGADRNLRTGTSTSSTNPQGFFPKLKSSYPDGVIEFRKYEDVLLGAHKLKECVKFLRACDQEQVLPVSIPVSDNVLGLPYPPAHRHALRDRTTLKRRTVGEGFHTVRVQRRRYQHYFPVELRVQLHSIAKRTVLNLMIQLFY